MINYESNLLGLRPHKPNYRFLVPAPSVLWLHNCFLIGHVPYVHAHIANVVSITRRVMLVLVLVQVLHRVKVLREWIIIVEDEFYLFLFYFMRNHHVEWLTM